MFNRQFWFGLVTGLAVSSILRQRKQANVIQSRLNDYYHRRAKNYNLTDYLYLGQFPRITMRKTLMQMANLQPGDHVLDFACGTGLNFPYIMERIGPTGRLVGVDYSQDMLDVASETIRQRGWQNVELVQSDAAEMQFDEQFDLVMVTLGLAVIPRWETAMERGMAHVKPGGTFGVADIKESSRLYTLPIRFLTDVIDFAIVADSSRRPWELMPAMGKNYRYSDLFHGYFYAATIQKPA